jgi:chromate transporter
VSDDTSRTPRSSLGDVARVFLKLGVLGFGGPAAHIAMMEDEVVRRRGWVSRERFLELLGATNLIPGPNSTEMAIHLGHQRAGWRGLLVAGACFILPAFTIVPACAWAYVRWGSLPAARGLLYGIKPVIIAVVLQALWGLGRAATRTWAIAAAGALALVAATLGVNELLVLLAAGLALGAIAGTRHRGKGVIAALAACFGALAGRGSATGATASKSLAGAAGAGTAGAPAAGTVAVAAGAAAGAAVPFGLAPLFLFFLKVGSILYGSGYVLLAFLRADLVHRWGWMTEGQLLDAVAVGQVTPGPVFTTATFIGYVLGGAPGAVLATVGIFLPSFVFVALSGPLVPRLRRSAVASGFLDGVNVASIALMAVVTAQLARAAVVDVPTAVLALVAAVLLIRFHVGSAWLVPAGALAGLAVSALR